MSHLIARSGARVDPLGAVRHPPHRTLLVRAALVLGVARAGASCVGRTLLEVPTTPASYVTPQLAVGTAAPATPTTESRDTPTPNFTESRHTGLQLDSDGKPLPPEAALLAEPAAQHEMHVTYHGFRPTPDPHVPERGAVMRHLGYWGAGECVRCRRMEVLLSASSRCW